MLVEDYLELMENRLSSSELFSHDLLLWRSPRRSKKTSKIENIEPVKFENRIIFMSMFNDIDSTKRGPSERCISCGTLHTCSGGCVWDAVRRNGVLRAVGGHTVTVI